MRSIVNILREQKAAATDTHIPYPRDVMNSVTLDPNIIAIRGDGKVRGVRKIAVSKNAARVERDSRLVRHCETFWISDARIDENVSARR